MTKDEKCSANRYVVYRFPGYTKLSAKEEEALRLIMKQDLRKPEWKILIPTLREVHRRDQVERKMAEEAKKKAAAEKRAATEKAKKAASRARDELDAAYTLLKLIPH